MKEKFRAIRWFSVLIFLLMNENTYAQLKGNHLLGDHGLNAGTQMTPSVFLALPFNLYETSQLKSAGGTTETVPQMYAFLTGVEGKIVTSLRILDANYGASILFPLSNNRIEGNIYQNKTYLGISDIYLQPLQLGWHLKRADLTFGYGLYFPSGKYKFDASGNRGLGMWANEFSGGTTIFFGAEKIFNFSALASYETHSDKKKTDVKVGDLVTVEGGLCGTFKKETKKATPMVLNVGPIYYMQFKVTEDQIPEHATRKFPDVRQKDRIFAAGAELNFYYSISRTSFSFRWLGEFGGVNRFQGNNFFITIGQFLKHFEKQKE